MADEKDTDHGELWDAVQQTPLANLQRSIQNYQDETQRTTDLIDAEGAAIEAAEFPHGTPREQLAQLIETQGYTLDRGADVRDWPADEQELHRRPDWGSFDIRAAAVQQYRREKLADALITAGWRPPEGTV